MEWKCFTCEHLNGPNLTECEVCGAIRNLYAEEVFEHKEAIKKLETQVNTLEGSLIKTRNERAQLSYEVENLVSVSDSKNLELNVLKEKEIALLQIIKTKNANIKNLEIKVDSLTSRLSKKKTSYFFTILLIIVCVVLCIYILYIQVYISNSKADCITKTNNAFTEFSNSTLEVECRKEDIGARTTLAEDLNNDGKLDGIIIATFNGENCRNTFKTILYVYDLKNGFVNPPLSFPLSKAKESYISFRGVENGKLVFDKWNLKDYNQKKYDSEQIKNSHKKMYISIQNDSLISKQGWTL